MPTIKEANAREHLCPYRNFESCMGELCMAWQWTGKPYEDRETNNLVTTPDGPRPSNDDPPRPDGDGWRLFGAPSLIGYENSAKLKLPKATAQKWRRSCELSRGKCGRIAPVNEYYDQGYDSDDEMPF